MSSRDKNTLLFHPWTTRMYIDILVIHLTLNLPQCMCFTHLRFWSISSTSNDCFLDSALTCKISRVGAKCDPRVVICCFLEDVSCPVLDCDSFLKRKKCRLDCRFWVFFSIVNFGKAVDLFIMTNYLI